VLNGMEMKSKSCCEKKKKNDSIRSDFFSFFAFNFNDIKTVKKKGKNQICQDKKEDVNFSQSHLKFPIFAFKLKFLQFSQFFK
jgi:hypothetical protein